MDRGKTIDALIGAKVRAQRTFTYVSEGELASTLGIDVHDLARYETGSARFPPDILLKVAEVLGAKVSHLFQGVDEVVAAEMTTLADLPGQMIEVQDLFARLSPGLQDEALAFIRVLVSRGDPASVEP